MAAQQRVVNVERDVQKLVRKNGAEEVANELQQVRDERDEATKEGVGRAFEIASLSGKVAELQSQLERMRVENEASAGAGVALVKAQQEVEASKAEAARLHET